MAKRWYWFGLWIVVLLLSACSPAVETPVQPTPPAPPTQAPTSPPPTQAPTAPVQGDEPKGIPPSGMDPNGPVILYSRSGGIAGVSQSWELYPDGRVLNHEGEEFRVDPEQVMDLVAAFEQAGIFEMKNAAGPGGTCADCFTYEVAVRSGEVANQVRFTDVDTNVSAEFMQTMQDLNVFLEGLEP